MKPRQYVVKALTELSPELLQAEVPKPSRPTPASASLAKQQPIERQWHREAPERFAFLGYRDWGLND